MPMKVMKNMMNIIDHFDDIPVTQMVYFVLASNALWFTGLAMTMESTRMWADMVGYPKFRDQSDA